MLSTGAYYFHLKLCVSPEAQVDLFLGAVNEYCTPNGTNDESVPRLGYDGNLYCGNETGLVPPIDDADMDEDGCDCPLYYDYAALSNFSSTALESVEIVYETVSADRAWPLDKPITVNSECRCEKANYRPVWLAPIDLCNYVNRSANASELLYNEGTMRVFERACSLPEEVQNAEFMHVKLCASTDFVTELFYTENFCRRSETGAPNLAEDGLLFCLLGCFWFPGLGNSCGDTFDPVSPWLRGGSRYAELTLDVGSWMGNLGIRDESLISDMWIPGTHDTMARHDCWYDPIGFAKCQSWELKEQLDRGIRAIDIRVRYNGCDDLPIHHGECYQDADWQKVVDTLQEWITTHPTEFVLVFVQREYKGGCTNGLCCGGRELLDYLSSLYLNRASFIDASKWCWGPTSCHAVGSSWPTYGDFKGKLVFMRQTKAPKDFPNFHLQDEYEEYNIGEKKKDILDHATAARQPNHLYINHLSVGGRKISDTPLRWALEFNKYAYDHVKDPTWLHGSKFSITFELLPAAVVHVARAKLPQCCCLMSHSRYDGLPRPGTALHDI